ncbi:MAG: thioredoxin domain-containing protein [Syntrophobacteraceae bacterium]
MPKAEKSANSQHRELRVRILFVLGSLGLLLFVLSGLSRHFDWIGAPFSRILSAGNTGPWPPLWVIGAAFYSVVILSIYRMQGFTAPIVSGAVGLSFGLLLQKTACPLNLVNLFLLLSIGAVCFEKNRAPQILLTLLLLFGAAFVPGRGMPAAAPPPDRVAAEAAGEAILVEDLEAPLAMRIHELEESVYQLKKQRLDQMIDKIVLQKEAERNGMTAQQLIESRILSKGVEVTPEEIEQYYEQNRQKWSQSKKSQEEVKEEIGNLLGQQKGYRKVMDYAAAHYADYGVAVYLKEPSLPNLRTSIDGGVSRGPQNAPITIVEFSDYQCPACKKSRETVKAAQSVYSGKVLWVFKDFPLHRSEASLRAAEAARCANEQGKFWDYQDSLFSGAGEPGRDLLIGYASKLGLNTEAFSSCLASGKYRPAIEQDFQEGWRAGINSTPSLAINGKVISGAVSFETLDTIIRRELEKNTHAG